jgi:hypothetical protein
LSTKSISYLVVVELPYSIELRELESFLWKISLFFDENRHLFLLFSVNTKNFITFDPEWLKKCPFEDRKRETHLLIWAHKNIQPCTYLQKKNISSNEIFPPEFGFLGKYFLFGHFVRKNNKFGQFYYMKGLNRSKSYLNVVDLPYSVAVLKLRFPEKGLILMIFSPNI